MKRPRGFVPGAKSLYWEQELSHEVQAVISCWIEDCIEESVMLNLTHRQLEILYHHVNIAIDRQRTEYHEKEEKK